MTAVAWTAIGLLAAALFGNLCYLGGRIDTMGARLDARLAALIARIDALTAKLSDHIERDAG
jgi:hypothetical protein